MKRILITGENSYVGISIDKWLRNYPEKYLIDSISLRNDSWKEKDFSKYDVVLHVAGIAHIKETKDNAESYYKVNRDLAYEVAQMAKGEGVKQFIFLSSMSVYGIESGVIDKNSPLKPKSNYGNSKLQAEKLIESLSDEVFRVSIIRPPMIYGKGCKGNYSRLAKLALKIPVFPDIKNKRSMIYIDNLCEFVRLLIEDYCEGLFFPQNDEYVCTSEMVKLIARINGTHVQMTKVFNSFLRLVRHDTVNKVFGDLVYDKSMSEYKHRYTVCDFETSIKLTEK
ncbi:NAD-dependent epimerase/dehydratase family protein [Cytobacillus oceanisediminis]|uniref:NAD-dependent epimerase/dehydratase family protein n=1 Tax=Cytobacillus TaxID=2675230 RepID=UPI0020404575|nr:MULTISPECIES: NAD-dependent epimerase/dehydratase family protein [Cytobacillus]MBY0158842.1 NAD-dependent epimerase/dehydratase family protein [Cytobacillus firmus]MCM3391497.1 NAD-dependent epimerase/dehydratase family protein [Cytobacillus oceanisediminis]MCM3529088.1 NAD-dependent epimerase/dehydratase family protein [Cytobacillus oceanisediminis]UQX53793.1 NAD-dependent epimerase/dehydratase family protein [Cytobacillus pseudoceanisediminis]